MKKFLLFLCALVCSAAMSAKTIYLNTGGGNLWEQAGATFKESISGEAMTAVPNVAVGTYYVEIDDAQTTVHFQRMSSDGETVWNQTADLSIPADKNLYTITGWSDGTWSVYVEEVIDPSTAVYEIKHGWKDGNSWSYKTLDKNEDGTYSLRDIYGGTGCNWKSTYIGEKWIANPTLVGEPQKGDSAIFTLTSTEGDGAITITKIDNGEDPVDPIDPIDPIEPSDNVVYFVNAQGWSVVNCYAWNGVGNNEWPGVAMSKEDYQLKGADVYSYDAGTNAYTSVIFNCGNDGCKTGDLTWTAGKYYYNGDWYTREELESSVVLVPAVSLMGEMNDWKGTSLTASDDELTASVVVALEATTYEFKITVAGEWYGNAGTMDRGNCTGWVFEKSVSGNAKITADTAGEYKFVWTYADNSLSVVYPTASSISSVGAQDTLVTKVIRNGQVLIIRDGVAYDMMGQVVK